MGVDKTLEVNLWGEGGARFWFLFVYCGMRAHASKNKKKGVNQTARQIEQQRYKGDDDVLLKSARRSE
jgi:hypothetical protein